MQRVTASQASFQPRSVSPDTQNHLPPEQALAEAIVGLFLALLSTLIAGLPTLRTTGNLTFRP